MITVHLHCPLNPTGIGSHAQMLVSELIDFHNFGIIKLTVIPTGVVKHSISPDTRDKISRHLLLNNNLGSEPDVSIVLNTPQRCLSWLEENQSVSKGLKVAYTVFELAPAFESDPSKYTPQQKRYRSSLEKLYNFDQIWVPSTWASSVLFDMDPGDMAHKIKVLPEGISDIKVTHNRGNSPCIRIGTAGKFEKRKGYHSLIRSLKDLDNECQNPIEVIAWCHNFWDKNASTTFLASNHTGLSLDRSGPGGLSYVTPSGRVRFTIAPFEAWQHDMLANWARMDYMCFPTYTEGWGLPIGECMGLGVPTFATGATGSYDYSKDYFNIVNGKAGCNLRIACSNKAELAFDPPFFNGEGYWNPVEPADISNALLNNMPSIWTTGVKEAAYAMREKYSWRNSAELLVKLLGVSIF